jgi:hypothetical protein
MAKLIDGSPGTDRETTYEQGADAEFLATA